jgi:mono/diheme cytochrome c family protein
LARCDRPRTPHLRLPLLAGLLLAAAGCTALDDMLARVPIFAFMRDTPMVKHYEMPRPAPAGSVPFESPAGELLPPIPPTEAALTAFGEVTPNPVPRTEAALAAGGRAYANHCAVCHGPEGRGDGPIIRPGGFPFAPDLAAPLTVERTDGYLYAIVRAGRGLMEGYGDRVNHWERWYVVHYMRQLQEQAGAGGPGTAGAADSRASGAATAAGGPQGRE